MYASRNGHDDGRVSAHVACRDFVALMIWIFVVGRVFGLWSGFDRVVFCLASDFGPWCGRVSVYGLVSDFCRAISFVRVNDFLCDPWLAAIEIFGIVRMIVDDTG